MSKEQTTIMQPVIDQTCAVTPLVCEHRFDVVCMDGQFILDLWECRYCGQRIRRKKLVAGRPADM